MKQHEDLGGVSSDFDPHIRMEVYLIRSKLLAEVARFAKSADGELLDFGCGSKPYKSLFSRCKSYTGVDFENTGHEHSNELIDVFYDGRQLPFEDDSFDVILCTEVLEHLFTPSVLLGELARVLKPGGKLFLTCPFTWELHEVPFDYARYTPFAIRHLFQEAGLRVVEERRTGNYVSVIGLLMIRLYGNTFGKFLNKLRLVRFAHSMIVGLINWLTVLLERSGAGGNAMYINNVVIGTK